VLRLLATFAVLLLSTPRAFAADRDSPSGVAWRSEWPKFRPAEVAFTAGLALQVGAASFVYRDPTRTWSGGVLFDDGVRDALRLRTQSGRERAAAASDYLYYGMLAYPLVVDVPIAFSRGGTNLGVQMLAIDLESFALAGAIAMSAEKIGRARPMADPCAHDPSYDKKCSDEANLASSFVSGHTSIAVTGASLLCVHHQHVPLYGGGAPDAIVCASAVAAATAQAVLRVASDNHYASDVLLGAGVGFMSGYVLPSLLHYRAARESGGPRRAFLPTRQWRDGGATLTPVVGPTGVQLMVVGVL
jgi:membrane-associated phospholipid phosphatase